MPFFWRMALIAIVEAAVVWAVASVSPFLIIPLAAVMGYRTAMLEDRDTFEETPAYDMAFVSLFVIPIAAALYAGVFAPLSGGSSFFAHGAECVASFFVTALVWMGTYLWIKEDEEKEDGQPEWP